MKITITVKWITLQTIIIPHETGEMWSNHSVRKTVYY